MTRAAAARASKCRHLWSEWKIGPLGLFGRNKAIRIQMRRNCLKCGKPATKLV